MALTPDINFEKVIELTEAALAEVGHVAMDQLRRGAEISSNVEAAERDLRSALRQLVLAERGARRVDGVATPERHEPPA